MTTRAGIIANLMSENAGLRADVETLAQSDRQVRARLARVEKERDAAVEALRITRGNVASLGPAGALAQVHTPYREWLAMIDAVISRCEAEAPVESEGGHHD
jgi:hypothetical protein